MSGTVRAEAPGRLLELVRALGGSPERVLAAAGVTADDFADPDRPIEVEVVLRLVDAAAHEVGDDRFGLHAGSRTDYGALGVLTYAVLNAPTVGTALRNFERYARSHFRGPRINGDEARLELVLDVADGVPRRHHAEAAAVVGLRIGGLRKHSRRRAHVLRRTTRAALGSRKPPTDYRSYCLLRSEEQLSQHQGHGAAKRPK